MQLSAEALLSAAQIAAHFFAHGCFLPSHGALPELKAAAPVLAAVPCAITLTLTLTLTLTPRPPRLCSPPCRARSSTAVTLSSALTPTLTLAVTMTVTVTLTRCAIVHGRHDVVCTPNAAHALHEAWPGSALRIP